MKWQCPNHKQFQYFAPGRCLVCQTPLEPLPAVPAWLTEVLSNKLTLQLTLELTNTLARRLLR